MILRVMLSLVIGILLAGFLFLKYHPVFGGKASKEKANALSQSENFARNKFINQIPTVMDTRIRTMVSMLRDLMKGNPKGKPKRAIPVEPLNSVIMPDKYSKVTWFGHSTLLLEMDGKRLLLDPMFSKTLSPFSSLGGKRYSKILPIELEELSAIDVVILSHDHYDHLDYQSIKKLKDKVSQFYVPLGVGNHLARWGVEAEKIKEFDWWNEYKLDGLTLVCTPARHFSGRSVFDRDTTLWSSWVIVGQESRVYFSGDTGYGPHFAKIGEKYGPFDLTLIECGQYDERWSAIHMMPEETVQAHFDVKGKILIPIHWSAFTLAFHDWTDPIERVTKAARKRNLDISTPKIGETVLIGSVEYPNSIWWR
ncbi:MBL fold metallo-hydrolase [Desulfosporosinus shakirovi]|uniref:MBL fold metallo-hydrolase n=1 Tax=Desulfosporosinus shakirovi TaxID=2885154 RepID=UPI001E5EEE75|nr:MBL fold metallo-hydrolase [Desulfosporosinus sp. SRJS8]MCB8815908.1 MBL fold metallo-hydrolase [Desulfosporosinus sp. SRJS8]